MSVIDTGRARWVTWPRSAGDGLGNVADVPTWRRLAIVGLLGFVVAVAVWAFRPWTSSVALPVVDNKTPQATFECGALFGGGSAHPSNGVARFEVVLPTRPCANRNARRVLAVVDLTVGLAGLVLLITAFRAREASVEPAVPEKQ